MKREQKCSCQGFESPSNLISNVANSWQNFPANLTEKIRPLRKIKGPLVIITFVKSFGQITKNYLCHRERKKYKNCGFSKRDSVTRFSTFCFFHESVSPKPLSIPLGSFRIFSKIRGDIRSSMFATGVNDTGGANAKSSVIKV